MKLANALVGCGNDGLSVFRGMRTDSRVNEFQFWTVDSTYAAEFGEVIEAEIADESMILDLRECVDAAGDYCGQSLDELLPGLADALGIDTETTIERYRLWECVGDEYAAATKLVRDAGYLGWRWFEGNGDQEAFCLLVAE